MVDQGKVEEIDKSVSNWNVIPQPIALAPIQSSSSSAANMPINAYPPPLAKYEDLVGNPKLFMDTLQKLHHAMATKFMIPIIGGRDLDLHKLFMEVTSRGGIERILREKKWKDVTATFNFPSTATNASFILRKHYFSLLHHYEQIYYFKAQGWSTLPNAASWQSGYAIPIAIHGGINTAPVLNPAPMPSPAPIFQPQVIRPAEPAREEFICTAPPVNSQVTGVIDGKFENGYFVTVKIGERELKGVLYHSAQSISQLDHCQKSQTTENLPKQGNINTTSVITKLRRRRRKKSEIKRRDPAHPKPNRSGYNFFFAEQHARLKPLYQGRDREISRIIGELWTNIKEDEKAVYQEKAVNDKERYRKEMEGYRERIRLGQVISNAVPIQQRLPNLDGKLAEGKEVAEKDYSEAFEDEEDDDDDDEEEEEDDYSMSMSEYEEDAAEQLEDLNIEASKKAEPMIQSSNGVDQSAIQEAAEAALMLSKSNQMAVEEARETQEQGHDLNAVYEDQQAKPSTA